MGRKARSLAHRTLPFSRTWEEKQEWVKMRGGNLREKAKSRLPVLVSRSFQLPFTRIPAGAAADVNNLCALSVRRDL